MSKKTSNQVIRRTTGHWLVNTIENSVLCMGQAIQTSQVNQSCASSSAPQLAVWTPVEFKTADAAREWADTGSTVDLERQLGAPVAWQKTLVAALPPKRSSVGVAVATPTADALPATTSSVGTDPVSTY